MTKQESVRIGFQDTDVKINPFIFGHFIEFIENCIRGGVYDPGHPESDEGGIRQDVLEKAKGLRPTILRWPGGTFANIYHWMDAVGPIEERKKKRNLIWGGIEDNVFGTAEFIEYCRKLGAEPMICVNMASGTAEEAANWVEYCNGEPGSYYADLRVQHGYPEPFNVKYWCVGNESYAEPDLGAQHVPERYISDGWEFTKHMKLVDPTIKLVFVGAAGMGEWNEKVLDAFNTVCDYLSIHHYSGGKTLYAPFASLNRFKKQLDDVSEMARKYSAMNKEHFKWYRFPGRTQEIKLCVDEWNIWNSANTKPDDRYGLKMTYNWRDALWTACMMNEFARRASIVEITNLAQMVNVIAPIIANSEGSFAQTTYHVLKLYRDFMDGCLTECTAENMPVVDAGEDGRFDALDLAASLSEDGTLRLFAANISQTEAYALCLPEGCEVKGCVCLCAESFDETNGMACESVKSVRKEGADALNIAPGSVHMIEIIRK